MIEVTELVIVFEWIGASIAGALMIVLLASAFLSLIPKEWKGSDPPR